MAWWENWDAWPKRPKRPVGRLHEFLLRQRELWRVNREFRPYDIFHHGAAGLYLATVEWSKTTFRQRDHLAAQLIGADGVDRGALSVYRNYRGCAWSDMWRYAQPTVRKYLRGGILFRFFYYAGEEDVGDVQREAVECYARMVESWGADMAPKSKCDSSFTQGHLFPHYGEALPKGRRRLDKAETLRLANAKRLEESSGKIIGCIRSVVASVIEIVVIGIESASEPPPRDLMGYGVKFTKNPWRYGWALGLEQWADTDFKKRDWLWKSIPGEDARAVASYCKSMTEDGCVWMATQSRNGDIEIDASINEFRWGVGFPNRTRISGGENVAIAQAYAERRYAELLMDWPNNPARYRFRDVA